MGRRRARPVAPTAPDHPGRRALLRSLGALAATCAAGLPWHATGCAPSAPPSDDVLIPAGDLPPGGRTVVVWRERPVEVVRTADGVVARSLVCTHMSCIVRFDAATGHYVCPCHAGTFDADGRPLSGPPLAPLERVPAVLERDGVRVGTGAPAAGR